MEAASRSIAPRILRFGIFELNAATGELRKRGVRIAMQEQPLRVLLALLERPGDIVTREELRYRLWPDGTFVDFEHSLNAAVRRLRLTLGDPADLPRFVETVHKRGYRFLALHSVPDGKVADFGPAAPATIAQLVRKHARVAVLPFGPFDGFTEGLSAEAMTQLTQVCPRSFGVIARTSVERARREGGSAAEIGRTLSADYLIDGQVRREGDRVRITAQLVEAQEETNVWARSFDRVMTDTIAVQLDVAKEIARAVSDALSVTRASA